MYYFFPGYQHIWHCIWYIARSFTLKDEDVRVDFDMEVSRLPKRWTDVFTIPLTTMLLTVPQPKLGDFVFVPYIVHHVMGYPCPVWFSVFPGALFTMYVVERPVGVLSSLAALVSREIRGDRRRLGTLVAGICHGILSIFEFTYMDSKFSFLSAVVVICMAECKLRMRWEHELVPPIDSLFACPVYILNYFMYYWEHVWKYTDKVWLSADFLFPLSNIVGAWCIREYVS